MGVVVGGSWMTRAGHRAGWLAAGWRQARVVTPRRAVASTAAVALVGMVSVGTAAVGSSPAAAGPAPVASSSSASSSSSSPRSSSQPSVGSSSGQPSVRSSSGQPSAPSSGFDDWSCRPSSAHPQPVVLLHGLGATWYEDTGMFIGPYLAAQGYCVFALTYGATSILGPFVGGLGPVPQSAQQVAAFIDQVLTATGAGQVDLVGHSEGAFLSLYVPKEEGDAARIARVVALAPPTHGTTFGGLVTLGVDLGLGGLVDAVLSGVGCAACTELITGGSAVAQLDDGPIAQPGVSYTVIASTHDELVTPTGTAFVEEPGVTNEYLQTTCPDDPVGHIGEAYDPDVAELIADALDPAVPVPVACTVGLPF